MKVKEKFLVLAQVLALACCYFAAPNQSLAKGSKVKIWKIGPVPTGFQVCLSSKDTRALAAVKTGVAGVAIAIGEPVSKIVGAVLLAFATTLVSLDEVGGNKGVKVYFLWPGLPGSGIPIPWYGKCQ